MEKMEKKEMEARIEHYKEQYVKDALPSCSTCSDVADVYDSLAGEDFCTDCLEKDLMRDIDTLLENTVYEEDKDE